MEKKLHELNFFDKYFPPPLYSEMPSIGVDISTKSLRFIELSQRGLKMEVGVFGERKITPNIVNSDDITKDENLKLSLKELRDKYGFRFVSVSLPDEKSFVFKMTIPKVALEEVRGAVYLRIEEQVPMKADEVLFDYAVINSNDDEENEHKNHMDVGVVAFPKKTAANFIKLFEEFDFLVVSLEVTAVALSNAIIKRNDPGTYMIANFGENTTGIYIVSHGIVLFSYKLNFGSETLDQSIKTQFGVSEAEVEDIKKGIHKKNTKDEMRKFYSQVNPITALRDEIKRIHKYWQTHSENGVVGSVIIDKIILCGRDLVLKDFDINLAASVGINVEIANVWENVFSLKDYIPPIFFEDSLNFATAIGLALPKID